MLWWNHLSKTKKVLYGGAILCFAAGVSARGSGVIGGVLLFLVFFILAVLLPDKRAKTKEEKEWNYVISPHFPKQEKTIHLYLNIVSVIIALIDIYFLFDALVKEKYILIFVCSILLIIIFTTWLMMNPKYYNEIYLTKKIIPLHNPTTTRQLYERTGEIKTPFGTPLMGFVPDYKDEVAVFRIIDLFWIVYYYVDKNEIHIAAERISEEAIEIKEIELVYQFIQDLADLFCFIENTGELPDSNEVIKLFPLER